MTILIDKVTEYYKVTDSEEAADIVSEIAK
jgi:hypothetical protein